MAFYTKPLYAFVHLFANGTVEITGTQSNWASPTPVERNYPDPLSLTTFISDRVLNS